MKVRVVDTVVATDSVGRPVDAIPVRVWADGETDAANRPVAPVVILETTDGAAVRFVSGKAAQNSTGEWVDTVPVDTGLAHTIPAPSGYRWSLLTHNGEPVTHLGVPVETLVEI